MSAQWGVLAEMSDRDFEVRYDDVPELGASFRLEGATLVEDQFRVERPLGRWTLDARYSLDPASGTVTFRQPTAGWGTITRTGQATPDGSIVGDRFSLRRDGDGGYVLEVNYGSMRGRGRYHYRPVSQGSERLRQAIAVRVASGVPPARPESTVLTGAPTGASNLQAAISAPAAALSTAPAAAQIGAIVNTLSPRVALVVGVSNYGTLGNLANPVNDAQGLAQTLRNLGFDVELALDPDQRALKDSISRLGERMSRAGRGTIGLFFFAGHGIQSRGVNYLIPSGAVINREADLALEAVPADTVLLQMQEAGVSTNIIILDACRNMPLTRSFRNSGRGLAQMDAPNGTFIAYSTAPGSVAADGAGPNSPFASALLQEIAQPGQPIEAVFRNVRRSVLQATEGLQTPWDSSSLTEPFFFRAQ